MRYMLSFTFFLFRLTEAYCQSSLAEKVICKGATIEIGDSGSPELCYSWKSSPQDPSVVEQKLDKINVSPTSTTLYTRKSIGEEFGKLEIHTIRVIVIEFDKLLIKESEEPDEFFEAPEKNRSIISGAKFEFKVTTKSEESTSVPVVWELREVSTNITLGTFSGSSFSYTFPKSLAANFMVRCWFDNNENKIHDVDECSITETLNVRETNIQVVNVAHAASITKALTNDEVDKILNAGTTMLRKKDLKDDYRCAVKFTRTKDVFSWKGLPDEVKSKADFDTINANVDARIKIVRRITYCGGPATPGFVIAGCATVNSRNSIVVAEGRGSDVWIHEVGHSIGLVHRPSKATELATDKNNLMYPVALKTQFIINANEGEKFEN